MMLYVIYFPYIFQYKVLHLNIQDLSAKFDHLKTLLSELTDVDVEIDFMLLCETFINDNKANLFRLPNYNFVKKNKKIKLRCTYEIIFNSIFVKILEFESIFVESVINGQTSIVGKKLSYSQHKCYFIYPTI